MRLLLTADPMIPVPPRLYGGIERIIDSLLRELRIRGHEVGLVAHPESTVDCDRLFAWPQTKPDSVVAHLANARALSACASEFKPQLIHSFSRLLYLGRSLLNRRLPKLMSFQRPPTARTVGWSDRFARGSLRFTGCSEHIARLGRAQRGEWTGVPNFVDLERYAFVPSVADDAPLIFLSRIERIKGAHTAIEIARGSGRRLIIAGNRAESGPEAAYFREFIEPHIDDEQITYVGPVDDVRKSELLGASAALVVPIEWDEPFGIVFIEALACGTPVISCPRGSLSEIVEHGRHGYLVQGAREGILAVSNLGAIARLDCRLRVEQHFSRPVVVDRYEAIYAEMLRCAASS